MTQRLHHKGHRGYIHVLPLRSLALGEVSHPVEQSYEEAME